MPTGDLVTGTITYVDINDPIAVAAAIDGENLAVVTDRLYVIPVGTQRVAIFVVERTA